MSNRADRRSQPAAEIVTAHLRLHLAALSKEDARLRLDRPSAVNKMRIEARRLRSTLTTYGALFDPGAAGPLRDDLRWVGRALGAARDAQVLRVRLAALVAEAPDEVDLANAGHLIDDRLRRAYLAGRADGLAVLASNRYRGLLDAMAEFVEDPPLTEAAGRPAADKLRPALDRVGRKLRRAVRTAEETPAGDERDDSFHEARKRSKQLRYAAEAALPLFGRAKRVVRSAKQVQDLLGERQDAAVARALMLDYGAEAGLEADAPALTRLQLIEERRRDDHEAAFLRFWGRKELVLTVG